MQADFALYLGHSIGERLFCSPSWRLGDPPLNETYQATHIIVHSDNNFTTVMNKPYSSIGSPADPRWPAIVRGITSYNESSKEAFIAAVNKAVGKQGFMFFAQSLVTISIREHKLKAVLSVPVGILVEEEALTGEGGVGPGTDVIYQLPSALIVGASESGPLLSAAQELDRLLADPVGYITA
ncbi:hypothetical protein B7494_g3736 [Chlorociboria aeruginascens]|nr:hypothetical protein B7494_g3736 [Chlorociboria aeruginascens]